MGDELTIKDHVNHYMATIDPTAFIKQKKNQEIFNQIAVSAITSNPKLMECTQESLIKCVIDCQKIGLIPNTPMGHAYIIPYKDNRNDQVNATFQLGYKGLLELCHRTNRFRSISAEVVYETDEFEIEYGLFKKLSHKIDTSGARVKSKPMGYYATYHLTNGGYDIKYMSFDEMVAYKKNNAASSKSGSPWEKNFNEMAKKTVLKKLLKYAPLGEKVENILNQDTKSESVESDFEILEEEF